MLVQAHETYEKLSWQRISTSYTSHTYTPKKYGILAFSLLFQVTTNFTFRGLILGSRGHFQCFTLSWRRDNGVRQDYVGQNPGDCRLNAVFTNTYTHTHTHIHTHTQSHTYTITHTHIYTITHTHTNAHTWGRTRGLLFPVSAALGLFRRWPIHESHAWGKSKRRGERVYPFL